MFSCLFLFFKYLECDLFCQSLLARENNEKKKSGCYPICLENSKLVLLAVAITVIFILRLFNHTTCKFGNFSENFIFANSFNKHICEVKNSGQEHDLPTSVNDSYFDISQGFYFIKNVKFHQPFFIWQKNMY